MRIFRNKKADKLEVKVKARPDGGLIRKVKFQWGATGLLVVLSVVTGMFGVDLDALMPGWRDTLRPVADLAVWFHENGPAFAAAIAALVTLVGQVVRSAKGDKPTEE